MTSRQASDGGTPPPLPRELQHQLHITLRAHDVMDEAWDAMLKLNDTMGDRRGNVACSSGCAACCSYLVDTLQPEATLIAASVDRSDPEYRSAVMARLLDWEYEFHHWLLTHPMPPQDRDDPAADMKHDLWRGAWQARRIACPFLDLDDNTCTIYADRPATCRGHHACYPPPSVIAEHDLLMPPEGCFTKLEDVQRGELTQVWQLNDRVPQEFTRVLGEALTQEGIDFTTHLLPLLVLNVGRNYFGWPPPNTRKRRSKPPRIQIAKKEPS